MHLGDLYVHMLDVYLLGDEAVILALHVNLGGPVLKVQGVSSHLEPLLTLAAYGAPLVSS